MKISPMAIGTPTGTKDVLPSEAAELRYLETAIRSVFDSYGYGEVITPSLETEAALEQAGEQRFRRSFRLFDEQGGVLVLRPEMTTPIARVAATKMAGQEPPFRLCYFANSFRPIAPQRGRQSEFKQAGVELLGLDSPAADAEVLAVLCGLLEASGLGDFAIGLGESSFFRALLDSIGIMGAARDAIFDALVSRDMVRLEAVARGLDLSDQDRQDLLDVTQLRGGSEVLTRAKDLVRGDEMDGALRRLARTYYLLTRYGHGRRILFDLGIFRNFDYYTGIVFEVYGAGLGFPIGGGGRYDGLLARFGRPLPAVGFAIGLDRLHIAVTAQSALQIAARPGVALVDGLDAALELAGELRSRGVAVLALPAGLSLNQAARAAAAGGLAWAAAPEGDGFRLQDGAGKQKTVTRDELLDEMAGWAA